jgi:hypothetical protein
MSDSVVDLRYVCDERNALADFQIANNFVADRARDPTTVLLLSLL